MKKILVTGGAGFIGSHLCKKLVNENNKVICLDNFFTGNQGNIKDLLNKPNFQLIKQDIEVPYQESIDEIFNLACPASPVHYQHDPIKTLKTSLLGSLNMLELARKHNAKILHTSTSEVYGDPEQHPQNELYWGNVNPIGIRSCYDEGKRCSETLFMDYQRVYNLNVKIVRIFNTYGPNMHPEDGRVVSNFIVQALRGDDLTIYGDGKQTRSFQYIDDLVDGILRMMSTNNFTGPVNLGNPDEYEVLDLAKKILNKTKSNSKISFHPLPKDDPKRRKPDISLAKKHLNNWKPQTNLDEGLNLTIKYFKSLLTKN